MNFEVDNQREKAAHHIQASKVYEFANQPKVAYDLVKLALVILLAVYEGKLEINYQFF